MPCVKDFTAQVYTKIFTPRLVRRVRARGEHKRRYLLCAVLLGRGSEWPMPVVTSKGRNRKRSGSRKISNLEREREREREGERESAEIRGVRFSSLPMPAPSSFACSLSGMVKDRRSSGIS